jgi:hypothetical protein
MSETHDDSDPPQVSTKGGDAPTYDPNDPNTWPLEGEEGEEDADDIADPRDATYDDDENEDEDDEAPPSRPPKKRGATRSEMEKSNGVAFLMANKESIKMRTKEGGYVKDKEMPPLKSVRAASDYGGGVGGGGGGHRFDWEEGSTDPEDEDEDEEEYSDDEEGSDEEEGGRKISRAEMAREKAEARERRRVQAEERWMDNLRIIQMASYENTYYGINRRTGTLRFPFITPAVMVELSSMSQHDIELLRRRVDTCREADDGLQSFMDGASAVQMTLTGAAYGVESLLTKKGYRLQGYGDNMNARSSADMPLCGRIFRRQVRPLITGLLGEKGETILSDGVAVALMFANSAIETHKTNVAAEEVAKTVENTRRNAIGTTTSGATGHQLMAAAGVTNAQPTVQEVRNTEYLEMWSKAVEFDPGNGVTPPISSEPAST